MAETLAQRQDRTRILIRKLQRQYPDAHCALHHANPLELLVATILSAQCTDERVNQTTPALFRRYPRAEDYGAADITELEGMIRSLGFFRSKAKSLKAMGSRLAEKHAGEVPRELAALTDLPGVGRKTANVVLGNAFGITEGIVVDTHVARLSYRLGLTSHKTPEKIEADLQKIVPKKHWVDFSHWLIFHGRQICKARNPACERCPLSPECPKRGVSAPRRRRGD